MHRYWIPLHYTKRLSGMTVIYDLYIPYKYDKTVDYGTVKIPLSECKTNKYDPLFVILAGEDNIKRLIWRQIERKDLTIALYDALCKKFNIIPFNGTDNLDGKTPCGYSSIYKICNEPETTEDLALKRYKKKITRYCLTCGKQVKTYRSRLEQGRGLFCKVNCSNQHKSDERYQCTCLNCNVKYESIIPEDFCSDECETEYNVSGKNCHEPKDEIETCHEPEKVLVDGPIMVPWTQSPMKNFNEGTSEKPEYGYIYSFMNPYTNTEQEIVLKGNELEIVNFERSPIIYCYSDGTAYPYLWYLQS